MMEDIFILKGEDFFTAASKRYKDTKWPNKACAHLLNVKEGVFNSRFQVFTDDDMADLMQAFPELNSIKPRYRERLIKQLDRKRRELRN